ncbi:cell division cycle-associated 7-like protein isoform X6 [Oryctolagus cuniculus]|uniref:cell division cycle-associated 7-like protein isoform X6 n=1 Tax=Oryctolagus cuniculus TaxID=9986 RepID=UPI003879E148
MGLQLERSLGSLRRWLTSSTPPATRRRRSSWALQMRFPWKPSRQRGAVIALTPWRPRRRGVFSLLQDVRFRSTYFTEELRRIFVEDTDSEMEDFEGFTPSDVSGSSGAELGESDLGSDSSASVVSEEEEQEEEEEEEAAAPRRRRRSGRSSIGLRVAFQFPTKKLAKRPERSPSSEPLGPGLRSQDKQVAALGRKKSCRPGRDREESASESEDDEGQESSDALLKRNLNIKENKAVLARLLAELNSMPDFFPVRSPASASKKRTTTRRALSEGQLPRRVNPARSARPPERFALESFTVSAAKFAEEFCRIRRRKTISGGRCQGYRRRHRVSSFRPVEDITEEDLENVAITVRDKIYDKVLGNTCHQCRQKTIDTKTVCRNQGCGGVRGQFCGPCLRNRYGEDVRSALLDPARRTLCHGHPHPPGQVLWLQQR